MVQLHPGIQGQEHGQHVRKSKPSENTAAHGGQVPELDAHDVTQALPDGSSGHGVKSLMELQLP